MSLNIEKLENVKHKGSRNIARCPACAEQGNDNKGDHLSIDEQGRFSCVIYPGETGAEHRKRIFALVGIKEGNNKSYSSQQNKVIKVKKVDRNTGNVIKSNILGHLGRVNQTHARKEENDIKERIYKKDFEKGVPSVPSFPETENEISRLSSVSTEGREAINRVKSFSHGSTVIDVKAKKRAESNQKTCARCGSMSERFCLGEVSNGKYEWGLFCLDCEPHDF